jgi:hypothetical protein
MSRDAVLQCHPSATRMPKVFHAHQSSAGTSFPTRTLEHVQMQNSREFIAARAILDSLLLHEVGKLSLCTSFAIKSRVHFHRGLSQTLDSVDVYSMQFENKGCCGTSTNRTSCTISGRVHAEPAKPMPVVAQSGHVLQWIGA